MSTSSTLRSSDIWSKTIGHDPYAEAGGGGAGTGGHAAAAADAAAKARGLLELARHQNVAGRGDKGGGRRRGPFAVRRR